MINEGSRKNIYYYLFATSNFIAAVGGGMILGKGVDIIDHPLLQGSSILAFFIGTALGLVFLQTIPKKISNALTKYFSIFAAVSSVVLLLMFKHYEIGGKLKDSVGIIFFFLLSVRFSLWFFSRVLRAANAAGQQKIAWVELGYYSGMIGGLIIWNMLDIPLQMAGALAIDACLQFIAGVIDLYVYQYSESKKKPTISKSVNSNRLGAVDYKKWLWKLSGSIVLLTIGTQVVIFSLAHHIHPYFSTYILACYYLGVSLAAFLCKSIKISIDWEIGSHQKLGHAKINYRNKKFSFSLSNILIASCVSIAAMGVSYWQWGQEVSISLNAHIYLLLTFTTVAAFIYELISICLFNRIGLEEQVPSETNMIMKTYGLMGMGAAVSLWIISVAHASMAMLSVVILLCFALSIKFVRTRVNIHTELPQL